MLGALVCLEVSLHHRCWDLWRQSAVELGAWRQNLDVFACVTWVGDVDKLGP